MQPFESEIQRNVQLAPQVIASESGWESGVVQTAPTPYVPPKPVPTSSSLPSGAATFYATQAAKEKAEKDKAMAALNKALKGWF
jgi:hypothetical protein